MHEDGENLCEFKWKFRAGNKRQQTLKLFSGNN